MTTIHPCDDQVEQKKLRRYQDEAFDVLIAERPKRAYIEMASGLGKTVFVAAFSRVWLHVVGQHILYLVHMTDALEQARVEFDKRFAGTGIKTGMLTGRIKENVKAQVLFATFQTMYNMLDEFPDDYFTLVIVDEAHHSSAETYKEVIEHFVTQLLLGMTATPERMDGQEIEDIFGEKIYSYSLAHALADREFLADVDYRLMTDNISPDELLRFLERAKKGDRRLSKSEINAKVFLTEYLEGVANTVEKVRTEEGLSKTIIFCRNISHLRRAQKHFPNAKPYHSGLKYETRKERLKQFRNGELREILVVDMFNEAIDIPDADMIVFLRATESGTIWRQQLGRGLRKEEGKHKRVVVLDFVGNCNRLYMIQALSNEVDHHNGERQKKATGPIGIDTGWKVNFSAELVDVIKVLESLVLRISWEEHYEELKAYKERFGDCNVSQKWSENAQLGMWVSHQRRFHAEGKLSAEKILLLEEIGFLWNYLKASWNQYYEELKEYKERFGDCNVPTKWPENPQFGMWVGTQRRVYAEGKLSAERIRLLEKIGFVWNRYERSWNQYYEELKAYKKRFGDCNVLLKWPENLQLGMWAGDQRGLNAKGKLSAEKIRLLEEIGFVWNPHKRSWNKRYEELKAYKKRFGDCKVPTTWLENPQLSNWVSTQRRAYTIGKLSAERIRLLGEIGFVWRLKGGRPKKRDKNDN